MSVDLMEGSKVLFHHPCWKNPLKGQVISLKEGQEAYIHFDHGDRRYDGWIPIQSLVLLDKNVSPGAKPLEISAKGRKKSARSSLEIEKGKIRDIDSIRIGNHLINTWYFSPYPRKFTKNRSLCICEYCLMYFPTENDLVSHISELHETHPPGREIYRKGNVSIYEVQAIKQKLYCQCLCLLGKLFIDHKALFFDLDNFRFYVLYEFDGNKLHFAAYFSREIFHAEKNLACIVVLPPYQSRGYGQLLISLSYEISKRCQSVGTPETPLSDLGKRAYMKYWKLVSLDLLHRYGTDISTLQHLSIMTAIAMPDLIEALEGTGVIYRDVNDGSYQIAYDVAAAAYETLKNDISRLNLVDPDKLIWFGRKRG